MKLTPLADRVICEPISGEAKTSSGILLPTEEEKRYWKVVAVGEEVLEIEPGDNVIFDHEGAEYFQYEGNELASVREWDVLAKVVE